MPWCPNGTQRSSGSLLLRGLICMRSSYRPVREGFVGEALIRLDSSAYMKAINLDSTPEGNLVDSHALPEHPRKSLHLGRQGRL